MVARRSVAAHHCGVERPPRYWLPTLVCAAFLTPVVAGVVLYFTGDSVEKGLLIGAIASAALTYGVARSHHASSVEASMFAIGAATWAAGFQLVLWSGVG